MAVSNNVPLRSYSWGHTRLSTKMAPSSILLASLRHGTSLLLTLLLRIHPSHLLPCLLLRQFHPGPLQRHGHGRSHRSDPWPLRCHAATLTARPPTARRHYHHRFQFSPFFTHTCGAYQGRSCETRPHPPMRHTTAPPSGRTVQTWLPYLPRSNSRLGLPPPAPGIVQLPPPSSSFLRPQPSMNLCPWSLDGTQSTTELRTRLQPALSAGSRSGPRHTGPRSGPRHNTPPYPWLLHLGPPPKCPSLHHHQHLPFTTGKRTT